MPTNPHYRSRGAGGPRSTYRWDSPDSHARLVDHLEESEERTRGSRAARAQTSKDRIHQQGAKALQQQGHQAQVRDPSFGDDARVIDMPHPHAPGYRVRVSGPQPSASRGDGTNEWHMRVDPPGVEHYVQGEEVHRTDLGVFHPRDLPSRVHAALQHPVAQAAVQSDQSNIVGQLERHSRNSARGGFLTAYEVGGSKGLQEHFEANTKPVHLGPQF